MYLQAEYYLACANEKVEQLFSQVGANDLTARRLRDRKINLEVEGIN